MAYQFTIQTSLGLSLIHDSRETLIHYASKAPPIFTLHWIDPKNNDVIENMHHPVKNRKNLVLDVEVNEPERVQPLQVRDDRGVAGGTGQAYKDSFEIALKLMRYDPEKHSARWTIREVCEVTNILAQSGFNAACKEIKRENLAIARTEPKLV
ncbi:hypothetical protein [Spirosoma sordidisoli]|uniref:Uncharacterized protein n=1 Tax=Spirosoma sordidisoli TaxID=2502893 RepID=A0A4Q2UHZ6_9BACT|nr:hypothetical protein [Spirosoma sordidisoli]RYC66970.1 hypothetical protein EQG79_26715 [Spirosoma sordidisoli]